MSQPRLPLIPSLLLPRMLNQVNPEQLVIILQQGDPELVPNILQAIQGIEPELFTQTSGVLFVSPEEPLDPPPEPPKQPDPPPKPVPPLPGPNKPSIIIEAPPWWTFPEIATGPAEAGE